MARPDPFLNLLKDFGMIAVRLPLANISPLNVIEKHDKDLNLVGDLNNAVVPQSAVTPPPVTKDIQTANNIQGQKTSTVNINVGVTIIGNILQALTGQNLGVSAAFQQASTVQFEFSDVVVDKIDIILLDQFLNQSTIHPASQGIQDRLNSGNLGVITATARTKKYTVSAQRNDGTNAAIDVPVLQGVAGGNLKVQQSGGSNSKVSFEGPVPVVFGVQAVHISRAANGKLTAFDPLEVGEGAVREDIKPNFITVQPIFVDLRSTQAGMTATG